MATKETRVYFGCKVVQRDNSETVPFFVFYARAKDVHQWSGIRRSHEVPEGIQRILRPTRTKAIGRFLRADENNTIPGNVLVAFGPDVVAFQSLDEKVHDCVSGLDIHNNCEGHIEWGYLTFSSDPSLPAHLKPALIVDGQHRLFGISEFMGEDLPILVVALIDCPVEEQAFQFVVINNKAVRVSTDNVKSIVADLSNDDELQQRLLKAGVRYGDKSPILRDINDLSSSPFRGLLDWPYNRDGQKLVPLTAIEQSLRYLQVVFPFLAEDESSLIEVFLAIWRAISETYSDFWGQDHVFMSKVNINALNEFLADRLLVAWELGAVVDIFDSDAVTQQVRRILAMIPEDFWKVPWTVGIQDNSNVRRLIKDDLATLMGNLRRNVPWATELQLISTVV